MNIYKNLLFIKGEDKTFEVSSCTYNKETRKYDVQFGTCNEKYSYSYSSITWLRNPVEIPPAFVRISYNKKPYFDIKCILEFGEYWKLIFENGTTLCLLKSQIDIDQNSLLDRNRAGYFEYFKNLAEKISLKTEDGKNLLKGQFEKISFISSESVLNSYFKPEKFKNLEKSNDSNLYFPFGCNNSQIQAVKYALTNKVSVIEGPPGTGKTQTILNIIANIVMRGMTVAVVSNNNSATENVYEKMDKNGFGFITAFLGKAENKKEFIHSKQLPYPDFNEYQYKDGSIDDLKMHSINLQVELEKMLEKQNKLAMIRAELKAFQLEKQYFLEYYNETYDNNLKLRQSSRLSAQKILNLWLSCQSNYELNKKITLWFKIKNIVIFGIVNYKFFVQPMEVLIPSLIIQYYEVKEIELNKNRSDLEQELKTYNFKHKMDEMVTASSKILKHSLYKKYGGAVTRNIFTEDDLYKKAQEFNREYPVILSTTHSIRNSLNAEYMYDYVIVDEASQVDLLTGVLTLSCARNIVVVGDLKQLPNVIPENIKIQTRTISDLARVEGKYRYEQQNLLSSICEVFPEVPKTLLREHYRCHPKIIEFCNQKFYKNQLIIMTEDNNEKDVLKVYKTVAGNHSRGHYNQRQIDEIKATILPELMKNSGSCDIGIIAPYKAQTQAMSELIDGIEISTVHKFQGREKSDIVISTVDNEITEFTDNPNLLNVAVSRAKNRLYIILSENEKNDNTNIGDLVRYIQYNNFEVVRGEIYSIFDMLYSAYAEQRKSFLKKNKKISHYDSESLMFGLIEEILKENQYDNMAIAVHQPLNMLLRDLKKLTEAECKFAMNCATHLDFLIFNKLDKAPILAIEVDGYDFHKTGTIQSQRDDMKDEILEKYGIEILRFKTNCSGEKEKLSKKMEEIQSKNREETHISITT